MAGWTLAELLDLEAAIARDHARVAATGGDERALVARDRRIAAQHPAAAAGPVDERLRSWVAAMRAEDPGLPGRRLVGWFALLRAGLLILAALLGCALAAALFAYDGERPIPLLRAIGLLILLPGATWALSMLLHLLSRGGLVGPASDPLRWLFSRLVVLVGDRCLRRDEPPGWIARFAAAARRREHGRLQAAPLARGLLGSLAQWFGVVLFGSAALWLLAAAATSDLAFAWGTSMGFEADGLQRALAALSAPFAWLWPAAVPSPELVESSRYLRLEDRFAAGSAAERAADPAALATWWRFLLAGCVTWAVVPRLLSLVVLGWGTRRTLTRLATQVEPGRSRVLERLAGRDAPAIATPAAAPLAAVTETPAPLPAGEIVVVGWDGCEAWPHLAAHLASHGLVAERSLAAGSGVAADDDDAAIAGVATSTAPAVLLAVPADEQPVSDLRAFLRELRIAAGPRPVAVAVCGARDPVVADAWRRSLAAAGDAVPVCWWEAPA